MLSLQVARGQLRTSILPEASFFMVMRSSRQRCGGAASEPWRLTDWNISVRLGASKSCRLCYFEVMLCSKVMSILVEVMLYCFEVMLYSLRGHHAVLFLGHVVLFLLRSCCDIEVMLCYFLLCVPTWSHIFCCDVGTIFFVKSYGITFTFKT